jgi:mono/diheme cytochrome c family protein
MSKAVVSCLGIVFAGVSFLQTAVAQTPNSNASPGAPYRALLGRYCFTCHNETLKTAGLVLSAADVENPVAGAEVWEKVIRKLRTRGMPPTGMPRPTEAEYDAFATYLETTIDQTAAARPNPGRPLVHRLNRAEYTNAVRDLLAMEVDGETLLPPDDQGYGFDNIADVLSVSPMLLERYMAAARKISRLAVGGPISRPAVETHDVSRFLQQDDRMSEDLPFGSRGGVAVRHFFPLDGEYLIQVRLQRDPGGFTILGLSREHQMEVRLDDQRLKAFPVGGRKENSGGLRTTEDEYELTADKDLELRLPVKAGTRLIAVSFAKETWEAEDVIQPRLENRAADIPAVASVIVTGPYNPEGPGETASRAKIFVCHPANAREEDPCARRILSALSRNAYRRPSTERDVEALFRLYQEGRKEGSFEAGIERAVQGLLVAGEFLFRVEQDSAGAAEFHPISDLELASRLSFFLWSSIPDDELLKLAENGKLREAKVLEQQVRRMLADPRSKALVSNFGGQWLYLRNMRMVRPDATEFPEFDDNLREALLQETELLFASMLREDRPAADILGADYTFLNERLARHYRIPNVYGSHFRRVKLQDEARNGLLGQGSILTVTSYANRTAPTIRGKWILANILGAPPPPPPPDVPSLQEDGDVRNLTMRARMELHRKNPVCASCHARMDPLGFALENFDAVGKWRTTVGADDAPIDASGVTPDGLKFDGPAGLRGILMDRQQEFVSAVAERLLTYALGRGVEYYDQPAIRKILREAQGSNYRWSSLILAIARSTPFQMRGSRQP